MKRLLLTLSALLLFLSGCATQAPADAPQDEPPTISSQETERLLTLDGRRYSFDGSSDELCAEEDRITILAGGTYRVQGTLTEGSLRVVAPPDATVRLIFDTVSITSTYHPPLFLEEAACVILEAERGTVNRLTDAKRQGEDSPYPDGCLVSNCDLILRGRGTLCVSGRQDTALVCAKDLSLSQISLTLSAPTAGIWVRDRLRMESGSLTVSSAKQGIVTDNGDTSAGILDFSGGRLTLSCSQVALVASSYIRVGETRLSLSAPTRYQAPRVELPDGA